MSTKYRLRAFLLPLLILGLIPAVTAANVTIERGDTFNLAASNTSITWGYDQTFNISLLAGYNHTLGIGQERNISIYAEGPAGVNVTMFDYNLSRPVEDGQQYVMMQVDAPDGSDVVFTLTGFPAIDGGSFHVNRSQTLLAQRYSGRTIAWTHNDWSTKNITMTYIAPPSEPDTGGSIDVDPFCQQDVAANNLHTWFATGSQFTMTSFDRGIGLQQISVETRRNVSNFGICAQRLNDVTVAPPQGAVHRYYNLTTKQPDAVTAATVTFHVDQGFARNHDQVHVARYTGTGWTELDAEQVDTTTYRVETDGFSRFAVYGTNTTSDDRQDGDQTDGNQTGGNATRPVCGDNQCNGNETWKTCTADCPKPAVVVEADNLIQQAEANISQDDPGYSTLQTAKTAYNNGNYTGAVSLAKQALQTYRAARQSDRGAGLPLLPIIVVFLLAVVVLGGIWKRNAVLERYHQFKRKRKQQRAEQHVEDVEERRDKDSHEYDTSGRLTELRLNDVASQVREELEQGQYSERKQHKLYDYLNQAGDAVKQEDYLRAEQLLDKVTELLEE